MSVSAPSVALSELGTPCTHGIDPASFAARSSHSMDGMDGSHGGEVCRRKAVEFTTVSIRKRR